MILFIFLNNIVTKEYILHRYVITYTFSVFVNNKIEIIKVHNNRTHETPNMTFKIYICIMTFPIFPKIYLSFSSIWTPHLGTKIKCASTEIYLYLFWDLQPEWSTTEKQPCPYIVLDLECVNVTSRGYLSIVPLHKVVKLRQRMKFDNIRINGSTHVLKILNVLHAEKYKDC